MEKRLLLYRREQLQLLCEAKRIIAREFDENLALHSNDMIERLLNYSEKSNEERLSTIYSNIMLGQVSITLKRGK